MSHPSQVKDSEPLHPVATICQKNLRYLRGIKSQTTYLDSALLESLQVEVTEIDVSSGTPKDDGPKVLELRLLDEMITIAKANDLIKDTAIGPVGSKYSPGKWYDACTVSEFYLKLFEIHVPDQPDQTLLERSPWMLSRKNTDERVGSLNIHWRAYFTLHNRDRSRPDVLYSLTINDPLENNKLLFSELWCILHMIYLKTKKKDYSNGMVAVTVHSISGREFRFVQGYVEDTGRIRVRKSEIVDIDNDDKNQNLERLMWSACWLLGDPCRKSVQDTVMRNRCE